MNVSSPARIAAALALAASGCVAPGGGRAAPPVFETPSLRIAIDPPTLSWRVEDPARPPGAAPLVSGRIGIDLDPGGMLQSSTRVSGPGPAVDRETPMGPARAWSLSLTDAGTRLTVELTVTALRDRRAVLLSAALANTSPQPVTVHRLVLAETDGAFAAVPVPPGTLRFLRMPDSARETPRACPAGEETISSHGFSMAADPASPWSLLAGFTGCRAGAGTVRWRVAGSPPALHPGAEIETGDVQVGPGERLAADDLLLAWDATPHAALEAYARAAREASASRRGAPGASAVPPPAAGWSTGHAYRGDLSEDALTQNLDFAARHLKPAGLDLILVEDGYQRSAGDWETHARLPRGHRWITRHIRGKGFRSVLVLSPLLVSDQSPIAAAKPDWVVREAGAALDPRDGGGRLSTVDVTHPDARRWLFELGQRVVGAWGYDGVMLDRLETPPAGGRTGDAAAIVARRTLFESFRESMGPDRMLFASEVPAAPSPAPLDGMRLGAAAAASAGWDGFRDTATSLAAIQGLGRGMWPSGPNLVSLAPPLSDDEARTWANLLAMTGGLLVIGDALPTLPAGRAALLQKMLPPLPGGARAIDLFDAPPAKDPASPPSLWQRTVDAAGETADVVLLVNWSDAPRRITVPLARLGRSAEAPCLAYDAAARSRLEIRDGALSEEIPPRASRMIVLRPDTGRPQVLSTSRHLVPGAVDLERMAWDGSTRTLRGRSRNLLPGSARIPGAPEPSYALDVHVPPPFRLERAEATTACLATRTGDHRIRVEFPDVTGDAVEWTLHFAEGERKKATEAK